MRLIHSALGLALAYQATGREAEADATLNDLLDLLLSTESAEYLLPVRSFQARLALLRGESEPALRWLQATTVDLDDWGMHTIELPALTRTKVLLADGSSTSLAKAEDELDRLLCRADATGAVPFQIEGLVVSALVQEARGRSDEALALLGQSLALAEPRGFLRTFVDFGAPLARLLRKLAARDGASPYLEWLLAAFDLRPSESEPAPPLSAPLVGFDTPDEEDRNLEHLTEPLTEPLTERELEVLGGLQRRLSNKEIAEELGISPLTVKRHASNIYGKLGVASRRQAIRRATEVGLLRAS
jgi:LuxR family maltose regulon positive regulatory protein